eukprot:366131-Chlamydomonas_euryale.AAC.8
MTNTATTLRASSASASAACLHPVGSRWTRSQQRCGCWARSNIDCTAAAGRCMRCLRAFLASAMVRDVLRRPAFCVRAGGPCKPHGSVPSEDKHHPGLPGACVGPPHAHVCTQPWHALHGAAWWLRSLLLIALHTNPCKRGGGLHASVHL